MQEKMPPAFKCKLSWPKSRLGPNIDRQLTITESSLIKPQTPALRSLLSSLLGVVHGEAELDPILRSRAPRGTSGTLPPAQEEPCLAHSGRHWAWRAWGSFPPPQDLGHRPIRVGSDSVGPTHSPGKKSLLLASSLQLACSKLEHWLKSLLLFNLSLTILSLAGKKGLQAILLGFFNVSISLEKHCKSQWFQCLHRSD